MSKQPKMHVRDYPSTTICGRSVRGVRLTISRDYFCKNVRKIPFCRQCAKRLVREKGESIESLERTIVRVGKERLNILMALDRGGR
jgi:hypothetical protein